MTYRFQPWPENQNLKSNIILIHSAPRRQCGLQYTRYSDPFLSFVSIFNPGVYALNIRNFPYGGSAKKPIQTELKVFALILTVQFSPNCK